MLAVRSLIFNVLYYLNLIVWMLVALPSLLMPRAVFRWIARHWAASSLWLLRVVCGTKVEWRGLDKLPSGGFLVAAKHQSMWETFALLTIFDDPAFVLKRELQWLPFFGWYAWKHGSIPVNRGGGSAALLDMNRRAGAEARSGRQIVIFPEGTRRAAGAPPAYKYGIAHMYDQMGMPCAPIGLNSGVYWPRRKFLRFPGTIVVEIGDAIPPGLDRDSFFRAMQESVEAISARLVADGLAERARRGH
jgi:1-acyl-sn-glycerol-3-phosphate acyltransferase